jgi:molybdenum-dependent DNA-binding transcriptional regulator ModE
MLRDFSDTAAFVKVVEEGSFTAAARVLKTPKTRISRKVQELERRLGIRLLNRTTRSLKLTEAGAVYFEHCASLVKDLEDAENAVAELQRHPRGWLRITAPHWLANYALAPLLSEFRRFYPEIYPHMLLGTRSPTSSRWTSTSPSGPFTATCRTRLWWRAGWAACRRGSIVRRLTWNERDRCGVRRIWRSTHAS